MKDLRDGFAASASPLPIAARRSNVPRGESGPAPIRFATTKRLGRRLKGARK